MTKSETNAVPKKKKRQGPIRWEAVLPVLVLVILFALYAKFFMDTHLRLALQWGLTKAMAVQVDVRELETSFFDAHMRIAGIDVTNSESPMKNSVSVGEVRFGMLWDALLRAKIVINEAVVEQIEFGKPRKSKGWVKPPEPIIESNEPGFLAKEGEKLKGRALEKVQEDYNENVFGDLASILAGTDAQAQLGKIEESLASKKMAQELDTWVKAKQKEWDARLKTLPQGSEFQDLEKRLKQVKTKDFKTPQELQNSLKELDAIFKDADAKIKTIEAAGKDLDGDLKKANNDVKALEAQIKTDIKALETRFRIPSLDPKALVAALFKQYLDPYLNKFQTYRALAEKYVPPNLMKKGGKEADPAIQPRPRASGVSYEFGRPNSYPLFWLKRTSVSSQAGTSPHAGNIKGEILDVTTNQVLTGKPTVANLAGDFPGMEIRDFSTKLTIDNRAAESLIDLLLNVGSYPITGRDLIKGSDVSIAFDKANGALNVQSSLKALREFELRLGNQFNNVAYNISAKNEVVSSLLKGVFNALPAVTLDARFSGTLPRINTSVNSNLGPELQKGLSREINAKIAEARAKIEAYVQEQVGKTKAQIDAEIAKLRDQVDGEVKKLQAQADAKKKEVEAQKEKAKKDAEASAKKGLENEAKKAADQLKKRLGL